jgi:magnesium transporter
MKAVRTRVARPRAPKAAAIPVGIPPEDLAMRHGLTEALFSDILTGIGHDPARLDKLLADLHPADIADALERLPREQRPALLDHIPYERLGDVIAELEEGVRENVLQLLKPDEVMDAIEELESDDAAEVARSVEHLPDPEGPDAEDMLTDYQQKRLLHYDADSAGGLMQLEVLTAPPEQSVGETLAYIRENAGELSDKPGTVFVVSPQRKLLGTVSISRLVKVPLAANLGDVMRREPLTVQPEVPHQEVVQMFEKYDIHNLAVVNKRDQLLGRITIDDILDVVISENARQAARAVGLDEGEDLFAPVAESTKHRLPWLFVNLITAIFAAAVIALFQDSIAKLTTLAVLMPIVASMGGNATTQTQTVIIRGLALGQITRHNAWQLLKREIFTTNNAGMLLAFIMALGTWLLYKDPMLALVIAMATVANHVIAAVGGWITPIVLKRMGYDPAISTGVITTTFTDVGGFFTFLGLATLLLLH